MPFAEDQDPVSDLRAGGHIGPAHTYWYLTITPALANAVSERAALYYQGGNFR